MKTVPKKYAGKKAASRSTLIDSIPLKFSEKGAEFGQLRLGQFGKAIGGALGYSLGVQTSMCLLLDIATKASIIENDQYVLVNPRRACAARVTVLCLLVCHSLCLIQHSRRQ